MAFMLGDVKKNIYKKSTVERFVTQSLQSQSIPLPLNLAMNDEFRHIMLCTMHKKADKMESLHSIAL